MRDVFHAGTAVYWAVDGVIKARPNDEPGERTVVTNVPTNAMFGLAIDGAFAYLTADGSVMRAPVDADPPAEPLVLARGPRQHGAPLVVGDYVYWVADGQMLRTPK